MRKLFLNSILALCINASIVFASDSSYDVTVLGVGMKKMEKIITQAQSFSLQTNLGVGINFSQAQKEKVIENIKSGKSSDVIFFSDQALLSNLKMEGLVNINYIRPIIFSDLICQGQCKSAKDTIFIHSDDSEHLFTKDNSRAFDSVNFTNCSDLLKLKAKYKSFIMEDYIAQTCKIKKSYIYQKTYKTYYMAVLVTDNLKNAISIYDFFAANIK